METEKVFLIHHHHSDLVWRRTQEEYVRVREEQILNVLQFLRKHPEFKFCYAQTPIVETFLEEHPDLAEEFCDYVHSGRIEMVGGLIAIPDTNIPGGESQLRNLFYGTRWVEQNFGTRPRIGWYMDAFGMSAQIPQILAKSGFPFMLPGRTPGLSPEASRQGSFWWEGLDGSRVLAAVGRAAVQTLEYVCNLPVTYSCEQRMRLSLEAMKSLEGEVFAFYCTEEGTLRDDIFGLVAAANAKGGKEIVFSNPSAFFEVLAAQTKSPEFPVHRGELNPEFSGCYTTRIRIKQGNRRAEETLVAAEKMSALATLVGAAYPGETFTQLWRELMLVQFHDAICGCHVDPVCDQMLNRTERIQSRAAALCEAAATRVAAEVETQADSFVVFNTENWRRRDLVAIESSENLEVKDDDGNIMPTQRREGSVVFVAEAPSLGYAAYQFSVAPPKRERSLIGEAAIGCQIETDRYKVRVGGQALEVADRAGESSVFSKGVWIPEIQFREDAGDLWTEMLMGSIFSENAGTVELRRVVSGEVFTQITYIGRIARASETTELWDGFEQIRWQKDLYFYRQLDRIDLRVTIDWWGWDTKIMLAIPCEVDPLTAVATYEIPFGAVARQPYYEVPKEWETTLKEMPASVFTTSKGDWPAVRWVDYSDSRRGLTVANRGNPGHSISGKQILVSLLRSGTQKMGFKPPIGSHENGRRVFDFSLLPHTGSWVEAQAHRFGIEWNNPLLATREEPHGGSSPSCASFIETAGAETVVCSALKKAEEGEGLVLRLYETAGQPATVSLRTLFPLTRLSEADLNEWNLGEAPGDALEFAPFEIKTLRFEMERH